LRKFLWFPWLVFGAFLAPFIFRIQADPDLWGHVRFGLDMVRTHRLALIDPYSFTQDHPWINHEWLSEVIMGATYQFAGTVGLAILKGILVGSIFVVALDVYRDAAPLVGVSAFLLLVIGSGRVTSSLRPQLWSLLAFAILCRVIVSGPRRWWFIVLPAMFALWINFHGGWIVGATALAIWAVVNVWQGTSTRAFAIGVAVLVTLATLINPYGWRMLEFIGETVRPSRAIVEWQPLFTTPLVAWLPPMIVGLGLVFIPFARKRPSLDRAVVVLVLGVAAFRVERLSPFFIVAAVVLISPTIREQWPLNPRSFRPLSPRAAVSFGAVCVAIVLVSGTVTARQARCIKISGNWVPDRIAGRALADAQVAGTMVTWFDWGEYSIWHFGPQLRVSLDGRRETVYGDAVLRGHDELDRGTLEGRAYLRRLDPDYVWLPSGFTNLRDWLPSQGYRIDIDTPRSFVAVRAGLPMVSVSDAPLPACFPGP
jgi:hypothetical protein